MVDYITGSIIFGSMLLVFIRQIKKSKKQSSICGGNCLGCYSKCEWKNNNGKKI